MTINPINLPITNSSNCNGLDSVIQKIDPSKTKVDKYRNSTVTTYFDKNGVAILSFGDVLHQYGYRYIRTDADGKQCLVALHDLDKDGNINDMHAYYNTDGSAPKSIYDDRVEQYEYRVRSSEDNGIFDEVVHDDLPWHAKPQSEDKKGILEKFLDWFGL